MKSGQKMHGRCNIQLNFYGLKIRINLPDNVSCEALGKRFAFFIDHSKGLETDYEINLRKEKPDYNQFNFIKPQYYSPRNICYFESGRKVVNYHGDALVIQSADKKSAEVISSNEVLMETITESLITFQTGKYFDDKGYFRVHALAFSYKNKGVLVLLPRGGGKSTLILELIKNRKVALISEDTPLITEGRDIYSFPKDIGVYSHKVPKNIPEAHLKSIHYAGSAEEELQGIEKHSIGIEYFKDSISTEPVKASIIIKGERYLGKGANIRSITYPAAWYEMFKNCIVGLGLYQGLEYAINVHPAELFGKLFLGLKRAKACTKFLFGTQKYEFQMGVEPKKNAECLIKKLNEII